jgi:hypothetical protein
MLPLAILKECCYGAILSNGRHLKGSGTHNTMTDDTTVTTDDTAVTAPATEETTEETVAPVATEEVAA